MITAYNHRLVLYLDVRWADSVLQPQQLLLQEVLFHCKCSSEIPDPLAPYLADAAKTSSFNLIKVLKYFSEEVLR